jgi:hypothetical protein
MPFCETANPDPAQDMVWPDLCISWPDGLDQFGKNQKPGSSTGIKMSPIPLSP